MADGVQVDLPPAIAWAALCDGLCVALEAVVGPANSYETRQLVEGEPMEVGATYRFTRTTADEDGTPYDAVWLLKLTEAVPGRRITWRKAYGEAGAHDVVKYTLGFEAVSNGKGTIVHVIGSGGGGCCGPDTSTERRLLAAIKHYLDDLELSEAEDLRCQMHMLRQPSSASSFPIDPILLEPFLQMSNHIDDDELDDVLDHALEEWDKDSMARAVSTPRTVAAAAPAPAPVPASSSVSISAVTTTTAAAIEVTPTAAASGTRGPSPQLPPPEEFEELLTLFERSMKESGLPREPTGNPEADSQLLMQQFEQMMRLMTEKPEVARMMADAASKLPEMESLMKEMSDSTTTTAGGMLDATRAEEPAPPVSVAASRRAAAAAGAANSSASATTGASVPSSATDRFSAAMDSVNATTQETRSVAGSDDPMQSLFRMLEQQGLGGNGSGDVGGMDMLVQNMMGNLMSKDVLYEPMKDLNSKYPWFFESHGPSLSAADLDRYRQQADITERVVREFETTNSASTIMDLMMRLQELGSPPKEVLRVLAPEGVEFDADGMPKIPGMPGLDNLDPSNCSVM